MNKKLELFEKCTGILLPWHITESQIEILKERGVIKLSFDNHNELILPKGCLLEYIDIPQFQELISSKGKISFVFTILGIKRELFKAWTEN